MRTKEEQARKTEAGAEKTDDGGWTLTDCFLANDYDPNTNPGVLPAGTTPAEERKQAALRLSRLKGSYALLLKRVKDKDLKQILATSYLQDGFGALTYMDQEYDRAITVTALRKMNKEFDEVTIKADIGVAEDSVTKLSKLLMRMNGERPAASRKSGDEISEKILECIAEASSHFSERGPRRNSMRLSATPT